MKYTVVVDQFEEREIRPPDLYPQYVALVLDELPGLLGNPAGWTACECPACGSRDQSVAFEKNGFVYRDCQECRSWFVSPRPSPRSLATFRGRSRAEQFWRDRILSATAASRSQHVSSPRVEWIVDNALPVDVRPLAYLHLGPLYDLTPEIVAQRGVFVDVFAACPVADVVATQESGAHSIPRVELAALARVPGDLALVSMFETLEGEYDPPRLLAGVREKLVIGGRLLLVTVNGEGFEIQMLRERARGVGLPTHLNLFSIRGISTLLARLGFRVLELSTPGQLDTELVANACHHDPGLSLPPFIESIVKSEDPAILRHFQEFLQLARRSSHMRIVAEAV